MIHRLAHVPWMESTESFTFPDAESASIEGIVCFGGNLSPGMVLSAYRQGIFPWYGENEPILWWSPNPRFVLLPELLHVSESAKKLVRKKLVHKAEWSLTIDKNFAAVISSCAEIERPKQNGTWILPDMIEAYERLNMKGYAHSVEIWEQEDLVGGLYGISLGTAFFGESMFSRRSGASKVGFLALAMFLFEKGFSFIDCQVHTDYLAGMGAVEIQRRIYLRMLSEAIMRPGVTGNWNRLFPDFPNSKTLGNSL
jgi:leucyl/phenylalanyl-tRNA--protein transferase